MFLNKLLVQTETTVTIPAICHSSTQQVTMKKNTTSLTYKDAGVDIDAGNKLIERIKPTAKRTQRPEILGGLGGFGAACEIPAGYRQPVLISGTDGVGSKLKLATLLNKHDTIGIDLVAMCVNDIVVSGAEPLFFLDYYATGHLNIDTAEAVIKGIGKGCEQAGCALAGGETAEMPGMYEGEDYDLAGFCVGVVEKERIIDGSKVGNGNTLIALASSGAHSNGYSLIRKLLEFSNDPITMTMEGKTLAERLLEPTRIYVKSILELIRAMPVHAISHITGGGLQENIPRTLPEGIHAVIDTKSWQQGPLFDWMQAQGNITPYEMYRTFNCGVGMIITMPSECTNDALSLLTAAGETAWVIGKIQEASRDECEAVVLAGL